MHLNFVDLFSGAGGMSLGLRMAGLSAAAAVEVDPWATETYQYNFPESVVTCADICQMSIGDIRALCEGPPTLVAGGPPCQGFSHSNIVNRDPKDPRNSLFSEFVRVVSVLKPTFALLENVPGLLKSKTASGEPVLDVVKRSFLEIGYRSKYKLLQAFEYGVPQDRLRLFVVAAKTDEALDAFEWPVPTHQLALGGQQSMFGSELPAVSLWDAISDLAKFDDQGELGPPETEYQQRMRGEGTQLQNHEPMRHTQRVLDRFRAISLGMSEADVPEHLRPRKRGGGGGAGKVYSQNSRRQRPDMPCSTIVASSHTNFIHPYLHRNFTVREMLRIQSFTDEFVIKGKRAVLSKSLSLKKGLLDEIYLDQRMQVGNAVPPLIAKALGISFVEAMNTVGGLKNAA